MGQGSEEATYTKWDEVPFETMSSMIGRQFIVGSNMMIARVLLKQGAVVPMHQHENEQITYILEGALMFNVGGKEIFVSAGEVLCIPPNVPHQATAVADTIDLDIFNPPRQDWIDHEDTYLRNEQKV